MALARSHEERPLRRVWLAVAEAGGAVELPRELPPVQALAVAGEGPYLAHMRLVDEAGRPALQIRLWRLVRRRGGAGRLRARCGRAGYPLRPLTELEGVDILPAG